MRYSSHYNFPSPVKKSTSHWWKKHHILIWLLRRGVGAMCIIGCGSSWDFAQSNTFVDSEPTRSRKLQPDRYSLLRLLVKIEFAAKTWIASKLEVLLPSWLLVSKTFMLIQTSWFDKFHMFYLIIPVLKVGKRLTSLGLIYTMQCISLCLLLIETTPCIFLCLLLIKTTPCISLRGTNFLETSQGC